jgi:hypothetical protein
MATLAREQNHSTPSRPRFLRIWFVALIGIFLVVAYGYYQYRLQQENFANTNYFRVLSEAASQLDENLEQFISLYEWNESESNIRAILPSYKSTDPCAPPSDETIKFKYALDGK